MLKRLTVIILILVSTLNVLYASMNFTNSHQSRQCKITGTSRHVNGGMNLYLRKQYLEALFLYLEENYLRPDQHLQINFGVYSEYCSSDTINGKLPYTLGYDYSAFDVYSSNGKRLNKEKAYKTIILNVATDSINVKDCLKLLIYGLDHKKEIESQQKTISAKHFFGHNDSIVTVSKKNIDDILTVEIPLLNQLLKHKIYRQSFPTSSENYGELDIYIQNDSFYLYETKNINHAYYNLKNYLRKDFKTDTLNTSLFSFSEITDFSSDTIDNYIIFKNDGKFYHIRLLDRTINGPYQLPSLSTRIDKYSSVNSLFTNRGDSIILTIGTDYDRSSYSVIFKPNTGEIRIDSSSFCQSIKEIVRQEKQERDKKLLIIRKAETLKQHKYYALILVAFVIVLNLFLAFNKRL